jgi:hypothetical protein
MLANGVMTRLMEMALTHTLTAHPTQANGFGISKKAKALKHGLMVPSIKERMSKERNRDMGSLPGVKARAMMASSRIITWKGSAPTNGMMAGNTLGNGKRTKCMERANSHGLTGGSIQGSMTWIKSRAMGNLSGQMGGLIRGNGLMGDKKD